MADKMMRIAGRSQDGLAKPIKTDDTGRIEVKATAKRNLFTENKILKTGTNLHSNYLFAGGYNSGSLIVFFDHLENIKISIVDIVSGSEVVEKSPRVIFDGSGINYVTANFKILSNQYYFVFENKNDDPNNDITINANTYEIRRDDALSYNTQDVKVSNPKHTPFPLSTELAKDQVLRSRKMISNGYYHAKLVLWFAVTREFKVSIVDVVGGSEKSPRVIFEGSAKESVSIEYEILSEHYYIEIVPTTTLGLYVQNSSFVILQGVPTTSNVNINNVDDISDSAELIALDVGQIKELLITTKTNTKPEKYPTGNLVFKESPIDIQTVTKSDDGSFYVVDNGGVLKKYSNIVSENDPIETGLTWNKTTNGELIYLFALDDGFVFFSNYTQGEHKIGKIYRSNSISDNPTLVYEPTTQTFSQYWSRQFGVDCYNNGNQIMILGGQYGFGQNSRDLVFSLDGGKTFDVIKKSSDIDTGGVKNSHWHAVNIDVFHGLIWASEGDGELNRHVFYSENFGKSWSTLTTSMQPTAIIPYPDKVIFGRDSGKVGLDVLPFPDKFSDLTGSSLHTKREFKSYLSDYFFAMQPVVYRNETYLNFLVADEDFSPIMIASGDFGESWHGVWYTTRHMGIRNVVAIDDDYIYAYSRSTASPSVVYAKKVEWM